MSNKATLFYDANCFQHIPKEILDKSIATYDNKILSTVFAELKQHFLYSINHPDEARQIDLLFKTNGSIRDEFQFVDIGASFKTYASLSQDKPTIKFKRNPIICSAYYHLLPLACNPSLVLDPYGHVFNYILHKINKNEAIPEDLMKWERQLKNGAIHSMNQIAKLSAPLKKIDPVKLIKVNKKRLRLARQRKVSLTDAQLIVTALLWACFFGKPRTCILTADRDLVSTASTLMLSVFEKFVFNKALEQTVNLNDEQTQQELQQTGKLHRKFRYNDLHLAMKELIHDVVHSTERSLELTILFYNIETGELIMDRHKIPLWLKDFILEFKGNVDCYSLHPSLDIKYPLSRRRYDPSQSADYLHFDVFPRIRPLNNRLIIRCEAKCRYVDQERNRPADLSDFYAPGN